MWILRFHLLKPKDYNKISRICRKYGFYSRAISPVVLAKGAIIYSTQQKSWRLIGKELGVNHVPLYKFHEFSKKSLMFQEIFHVFSDVRIALYVGDNRNINTYDLDNSEEIGELTRRYINNML